MSDSNSSTPVSETPVAESTTAAAPPQESPQKKKSNKALIIIIILLILLVLILLYALFRPKPEDVNDGRATFVSPDNVEEVRQQLSEPVTDAYYTTSMTVDWYFDNGEAVSTSSYVENAEENTRTVYFDVTLEDGELIYSSPYLPVGERIEQIMLNRDLDAGDYPAVCTYYLVDDDHNVITNVSVAVTIHVLN
ncbi:MAG: hypothetical protein NC180_06660 [Muribaculaceae bacterium]|nr:hypothetical protein [Roseburia sp.]MCM1429834.1 hypothetical protein [Muribaculaceae bacterium]MCM1492885.1 hypothetical protein [Muribaculaceae bacterium]